MLRLLTVILSAHLGLQPPSMLSHSDVGGSFLGKQLQRGSLIRSQANIVGSSLYLRPAGQHQTLIGFARVVWDPGEKLAFDRAGKGFLEPSTCRHAHKEPKLQYITHHCRC